MNREQRLCKALQSVMEEIWCMCDGVEEFLGKQGLLEVYGAIDDKNYIDICRTCGDFMTKQDKLPETEIPELCKYCEEHSGICTLE